MMISKNQGRFNFNTTFGVLTILFGALMIVDVLTGGLVRENYNLRVIQYGAVSFVMIAWFGDLIKESDHGKRLLRSYSQHGL